MAWKTDVQYLKSLFSDWITAVGTMLTFVALALGAGGFESAIVPRWAWISIAALAFMFSSYRIWRKEWLRAEIGQKLRDGLIARCEAIILGWKVLDSDYQNAAKEQYEPKTLQEPMSPAWVSAQWKVWPYRIGLLQGQTNALREDLIRIGICVGKWDHDRISMPELLHALENYRVELGCFR